MTVTYGEIPVEELVISLVGNVDPVPMGVLTVKPRKIAVGDIKINALTTFYLTMKNTGNAPMIVTRIVSKKFKTVYFDAILSREITIAPGESRTVEVTFKAEKAGRYLDYIMVHSNARNVTQKGYKVVIVASASDS